MDDFLAIAAACFRVTTPLLFAALGGLLSERSGVINIALEGFMIVGAFVGAAVALSAESEWVGFLAAGGAGMLLALFYAVFVVYLRTDQIVAGTAINLLAAGLAPFLCKVFFHSTIGTPSLEMEHRFSYAPMVMVWFLLIAVWF